MAQTLTRAAAAVAVTAAGARKASASVAGVVRPDVLRLRAFGAKALSASVKPVSAIRTTAIAASGESAAPATAQPDGKLYVGNLPWHVDSEMLGETFQQFGAVQQCDVVYDRDTGRSRGFGFVIMANKTEAEAAISGLNGKEMDGRPVRVNFPSSTAARAAAAPRDGQRAPRERREGAPAGAGGERRRRDDNPNKLYVGNLSWGMDDMQLEDLFAEFGSVAEAKVVLERETGRSRGFGFVTMSSDAEVTAAIAQLDGQDVDGRVIRVRKANDDRQ